MQALSYYLRALPIRGEVGDRVSESVTRYNMAMIYRSQGQFAEAVETLRRVVELDQQVQHPNWNPTGRCCARWSKNGVSISLKSCAPGASRLQPAWRIWYNPQDVGAPSGS